VSGAEGEVRSVLGFKDEQRIKEDEERRKDLELKIPVLREYRERMINDFINSFDSGGKLSNRGEKQRKAKSRRKIATKSKRKSRR
jgi:hypothetical protein